MSHESALPEPLDSILNPATETAPRVEPTAGETVHEAMAQMFSKYPSRVFKFDWRMWRYSCTIDGKKVYATPYEYRRSRRIRFLTSGVL